MNALSQYRMPSRRRGGKRQSRKKVAYKVAWPTVKRKYKKVGNIWGSKD